MAKEIRLNRIILSELPELYNFKSFEGSDAFGIFSSGEVISVTAKNSERLGIDRTICDGADLPKGLSAALVSDNAEIKSAAEELAADLGRRLGLIFYVMTRDPEVTLRANPRYSKDDFAIWTNMRRIILVGGLANGELGKALVKNSEAVLRELGCKGLSVAVGAYPSHAQLIGASRLSGTESGKAAVFDFGHTFVKSAIADFADGKLKSLSLLPKVPSEYMGKGFGSEAEELREAENLHGYIVKVITDVFAGSGVELSQNVAISIANNAVNGKIGYGGCYYKLMLLGENYAKYLSEELSKAFGREMQVTLVHDGRAAALAYEEEENAAAVALGTAFGVGYTKGDKGLPNLSHSFEIKIMITPPN